MSISNAKYYLGFIIVNYEDNIYMKNIIELVKVALKELEE